MRSLEEMGAKEAMEDLQDLTVRHKMAVALVLPLRTMPPMEYLQDLTVRQEAVGVTDRFAQLAFEKWCRLRQLTRQEAETVQRQLQQYIHLHIYLYK